MISQKPEATNGNGCMIKVGTTGTIGSLMTRELEFMKEAPHASSSTQKKPQSPPVSVPCGSTPRKSQLKRNSTNESSSSSGSTTSSNGNTGHNKNPTNAQKPKHHPRKNVHRVPMLGSEDVNADKTNNRDEKRPNSYIVEVVDLKCTNPMTSRLKKLGFSKLSESTA
ncbi:hypothetical protein J5N97_027277 [Dioscorea zingiberensis]|uniref:Uncharacterized protein n=1 Tax=Dioscorea zingiberensis TaxID=325984 RepID=A0A9D5H7G8_9LILI|nr:hypothetical protein J5N97_027277 [Dioscorea zingiberensis]